MSGIKDSIILVLLLAFLTGSGGLMAGENKGPGDPPEILNLDCYLDLGFSCEISVANIIDAFPGQQVEVPVTITSDVDIEYIHLYLGYGTGLSLESFNTTGSEYVGGAINTYIDHGNNEVDIFFEEDGLGQFGTVPAGTDRYLGSLVYTVHVNVDFNETNDITNIALPVVNKAGPGDSDCDAVAQDGSITTIDGQASFDIDDTQGFSNQAQDLPDCNSEKEQYAFLPVRFKANYPVDRFNIAIEKIPEYVSFVPNDPFVFTVEDCGDDIKVSYDNSVIQPSETYYVLGSLKLKGRDFHVEYNGSPQYNTSIEVDFVDCGTPEVYCAGTNIHLDWIDCSHTSGYVQYFKYICETTFEDVYVPPNFTNPITMTASADHTFWSQGFKYFVRVNKNQLTQMTALTSPASGQNNSQYVNDIHVYSEYPLPYRTYDIYTHNPNEDCNGGGGDPFWQDNRFIRADSDEAIFTMSFNVDQTFANTVGQSSIVTISPAFESYVQDFFHPDGDANKIKRRSGLANFNVNTGIVSTPRLRVDIDDNVRCGGQYTMVPVRVTEAVLNGYNYVELEFKSSGPLIFSDITDGDYGIHWDNPVITNGGKTMTVNGDYTNPIYLTGVLLNLKMTQIMVQPTVTDVKFISARFGYSIGQTLYSVFAHDGSVLPCLGKADPCDDCPIPYTYFLSQAYPNPFNANTVIEFGLAEPGFVSLDVYDILGKKVKTLKSEDMEPGAFQVTWDGTNDAGAQVGSGFYFYILQSGNYVNKKRMTLLK